MGEVFLVGRQSMNGGAEESTNHTQFMPTPVVALLASVEWVSEDSNDNINFMRKSQIRKV